MMRVAVLLLALTPSTPLASAKPPTSRDVGRLVNEATTIEEALATAKLLPFAGEETQHWETQDIHIARRRKSLTALLRRVMRWTVGGAATEARGRALAHDDFARCVQLLAEPGPPDAYAVERRDGLRLVAALAQTSDALAPVARDVAAAFRVALEELDGAPGATTGLNWAARRCASAGVPVTALDALDAAERACGLPFRIHVDAVAVPEVDELAAALPLKAETIATRTGALVLERRRTAWLAEPGIGALAYSGKLMAPEPMPDAVRTISEKLSGESGLLDAPTFDCTLCNLYPAGEDAACKFHSDPEHGSHWHLSTAVVSCGEPRRFAFRRIGAEDDDRDRHVFHLFHGDVVEMFDQCQDVYQHGVLAPEDATNQGARVSLVLKNALLLPSGKKGHGLPGSGATRSDKRKAKIKKVATAGDRRELRDERPKPKPGRRRRRAATAR